MNKENELIAEQLNKFGRVLQTDELLKIIKQLEQENKELKKKYENAVADYETTMAEKNKLKRQLEDTNKGLELVRCDLHNKTSERDSYERKLKFIREAMALAGYKDAYEYINAKYIALKMEE